VRFASAQKGGEARFQSFQASADGGMTRLLRIAVFAALVGLSANGQDATHPLRTVLKVQSAVPFNPPMPPYSTQPVVCTDSSVYFPGADSPSDKALPIWRIDSRKGAKDALFEIPADLREDFEFTTYAVAPAGTLVEAVMQRKTGEVLLLRFSSDGSFVSHTRLSVPKFFRVEQLALFDTDQMFVAGYVTRTGAKSLQYRPLVAIFSPDGELVRKISSQSATEKEELIDVGKMRNRAVTIGENGYVYYLAGPRVIVVSAAGKIEKKLAIDPPEEGYVPIKLDYFEGIISVTFMQDIKKQIPKIILRTYEADSGALVGEFIPGEGLTNTQWCYSRREGYLFFSKHEGRPAFVRAAP
jgi:hypothetical protein